MITRNSINYTKLFEKASNLLRRYGDKDESFEINNIDEYFQHIKTLAAIENHEEGLNIPADEYIDPIYTILPLDEELFEIDADTRNIKIPSHFAKYGVGVQGDEIAEIIYFSIDRYFDAVDLANMEILIQWNRGEKDDLSRNLDLTYKRSLDYASGKIVFGWPISAAMTEEPGNIHFAVRFYSIDENDNLLYSFSTNTGIIKIQKGLDFDLTNDAIKLATDRSKQIYDNLRNTSSPTPGYIIAAPEFINYLVKKAGSESFVEANNNFEYDIDNANGKPCQFKVRAHITEESLDNGEKMGISGLTYEWYYKANEDTQSKKCDSELIHNSYEPIGSDILSNNEYYYYKNDAGEYHLYTLDNGDQTLYQKYSVITPNKAGYYYTKAINTYNFNETAIGESANRWLVPYPEAPILGDIEMTEYRIPEGEEFVTITIDVPEAQPTGSLSKHWYLNSSNTFGGILQVSGTNTIEAKDEGFYFLQLANLRNGATETTVSEGIKVLHSPSTLEVTVPAELKTVQLSDSLVLEYTISSKTYSTSIEYQWQKGTKQEDGTTSWSDISSDATSKTYSPKTTGLYRCVVTNIYEGASSSTTPDENNWITVYSV